MEITQEKISDLCSVVSLKVNSLDYESLVMTELQKYKRTIQLPGFRPGSVPVGVIKKKYGVTILRDKINSLVIDYLYKFIEDQKIELLLQPMQFNKDDILIDWENQKEFEFFFEIGIKPDININLLNEYNLSISKEHVLLDNLTVENKIDKLRYIHGTKKYLDVVSTGNILYVKLKPIYDEENSTETAQELDLQIDLQKLKDDNFKNMFIGSKTGDFFELKFKNKKLTDLLFPVDNTVTELIKPYNNHNNFQLVIKNIYEIIPAEFNNEFYGKVFPENPPEDKEDFEKSIRNFLRLEFDYFCNLLLYSELKNKVIKIYNIQLPENFVKKYLDDYYQLLHKSKDKPEYNYFCKELKWELFKDKVIKEKKLETTDGEIEKEIIIGLKSHHQKATELLSDEEFKIFAGNIIADKKNKQKIESLSKELTDKKFYNYIENNIKITKKEISSEDFFNLYNISNYSSEKNVTTPALDFQVSGVGVID